ncbi:MAG: haloacid dehalogenase-like hydrolase [Kiritimatiellaeota bacterium]|nr:haloacid dehalogenase-like hydrolase [Kiritimatiellota bacterium]
MHNVIAIVFDFDETLAPDTTSGFLSELGVDVPTFWRRQVQELLDDGWDPVPAYLYRLVELSRSAGTTPLITREKLAAWGRRVRFYRGATHVFGRLRKHAESAFPQVEIEFYVISSGIGEIVRNTRIAKQFTDIWACEFHYDERGGIVFPRNVVSFTDKTRFLFQISKGLVGPEARRRPFEVNRKIAAGRRRVPFDQMVFVGDGYTDIPCFSLVRGQGGAAIGVFDAENREKWGRAWGFIEDDRVSNLVPADYGKHGALTASLVMAINSIGSRILLRRSTYQG